jgi:hypothetical protein
MLFTAKAQRYIVHGRGLGAPVLEFECSCLPILAAVAPSLQRDLVMSRKSRKGRPWSAAQPLACWPRGPRWPSFIFSMAPLTSLLVRSNATSEPGSSVTISELLRPFSQGGWRYVRSTFEATGTELSFLAALRRPNRNALLLLDMLPLPRFDHWWTHIPLVPPGCSPSPKAFSAQVYISSTNGSAAPEHSDLGDALVLQLFGEKTWHFAMSPSVEADRVEVLRAGDALWLPAAARHRARAHGPLSIHLNVERGSAKLGDHIGAGRMS